MRKKKKWKKEGGCTVINSQVGEEFKGLDIIKDS